jgi:SAM-dependent methyltransferase
VRWYVAPLVDAQRDFNDVALKLIDGLERRLDVEVDPRRLEELEERVLRLERTRKELPLLVTPGEVATGRDEGAGVAFDYFAFESRMRGSMADIRSRQAAYVDAFRDAEPVLDVGCGRGEFLSLLAEEGIEASGVDRDPEMVAFCRANGLDVTHGDAVGYLSSLPDQSLGGIFSAQLVEHLAPAKLVELLRVAASRLREGGVLIVETMNPLSLSALKNYFADLTHAQPIVADTLVFLARDAGFRTAEVRYLNPPPAGERLRPVTLPPDPRFDEARLALGANVERLNDLLFGPQDYAMTAVR